LTRKNTEEGANGERGPRLRAVRLRDKKDARRLIGQAINLLLRGEIGAERGGKVLYGAYIFIRSIEADESRWAASESGPSPATIAAQIRAAMREANSQIPGPPEGE
jgi:hypothetical protein